jgi:hypothetical protein
LTTQKLNLTQQIEASLSYVFYMFNNKSGWREWFTHKSYGYAKKNGMLRVYHEPEGDYLFHFTAEVPEQRIAFDFTDLETKQVSQVEVSFEEDGGIVTISLEHSGFPADRLEYFKALWAKGLENLKSMAETGKDLRLWGRPFLGVTVQDWVTPEFAQEHDLPVEYGMQLHSVLSGYGAEAAGLQKDDILLTLNGTELHDYKIFLDFLATVKAGAVVELTYYRGEEKHQVEIELSSYPVSELPAAAHDYAEKIEKFQASVRQKIESLFEEYNDAQVEFRPGPGEWSAKEILGHLISYESDAHIWMSTLVGGCEEYPCSAAHAVRIKSLLTLFPTVDELMEELARRQKETVTILLELPAEFVNRRGSFARLIAGMSIDYSKHYKEHLHQIQEGLEKAENLRVN